MIESHNREGRLVACMYINKLSCSMREDYKLQKNMFKLSVKDKSRTNRGANPKWRIHVEAQLRQGPRFRVIIAIFRSDSLWC